MSSRAIPTGPPQSLEQTSSRCVVLPTTSPPSLYLRLSLPSHSSSHVGCRSALKTRPCFKGQSCAGKEGARKTRPRSQRAGTNKRCHCMAGRHTRGRANGWRELEEGGHNTAGEQGVGILCCRVMNIVGEACQFQLRENGLRTHG
jgi:hypothetical protein